MWEVHQLISLLLWGSVMFTLVKLIRYISKEVSRSREMGQVRDDRINDAIDRVLEVEETLKDHQKTLNFKLDALSHYVDERHTYVTFQQEQFKSLAQSDMLSSRRNELSRTKELKVALERLVGMSTISRQPPSVPDMLAIDSLTERIKELEDILNHQM